MPAGHRRRNRGNKDVPKRVKGGGRQRRMGVAKSAEKCAGLGDKFAHRLQNVVSGGRCSSFSV